MRIESKYLENSKDLNMNPLCKEGRKNGWRVRVWAVEVGCRTFPAMSMSTFIKDLGLKGGEKKRAIEGIGKVAEEASHSLEGQPLQEMGRTRTNNRMKTSAQQF